MKEKIVKVYEFKELSPEVQEKVIEHFQRDKQEIGDMLWGFNDTAKEEIQEAGFSDVKLQYSLSNSQGDGLSFSGKLDLKFFLEKKYSKKLSKYKINALCEYIYSVHSTGNTGHYEYASKNQIEYTKNYQNGEHWEKIDKLWQNVLEEIQDYYMSLCKKLEKQGYDEIEWQLSEESIKEDIEANDYEFTEDGRIFND
jgi:hypothetical protein